jgi:hypothetical protein
MNIKHSQEQEQEKKSNNEHAVVLRLQGANTGMANLCIGGYWPHIYYVFLCVRVCVCRSVSLIRVIRSSFFLLKCVTKWTSQTILKVLWIDYSQWYIHFTSDINIKCLFCSCLPEQIAISKMSTLICIYIYIYIYENIRDKRHQSLGIILNLKISRYTMEKKQQQLTKVRNFVIKPFFCPPHFSH